HFNPGMKAVMLALDEFEHDIYYNQGGKDLALHEFTNALSYEILQTYARHPDAGRFRTGLRLILEWMQVPQHKAKVRQMEFLRAYALTDRIEVVWVLMVLFFEKEAVFKEHFPDLVVYVGGMIKHPKVKSLAG